MIEIELTWDELRRAAHVGVERQVIGRENARAQWFERGLMQGWQNHINGACGELCVAKWLGVADTWDGLNFRERFAGDVVGLEIRTQPSPRSLFVYEKDRDERFMVYVVGGDAGPKWALHGYIRAKYAKRDEWWCESLQLPCWSVPPHKLRTDFDTLREHLMQERKSA